MKVYCALLILLNLSAGATEDMLVGIPHQFPGLRIEEGQLAHSPPVSWFIQAHQCVESTADIDLRYLAFPTPRLVAMAEQGELDILFPMGFDRARDEKLLRSESFTTVVDYFLYLTKPESFTDKTLAIAARRGTPQANYLKENGYEQTILISDYARLGEMLELGRIDMAAVPDVALNQILRGFPSHLTPKIHSYTTRGVGYYFAPQVPESIRDRINRQIRFCVAEFPIPGPLLQ